MILSIFVLGNYIYTHTLVDVSLTIPKTCHKLVGNMVIEVKFQPTHVVIYMNLG